MPKGKPNKRYTTEFEIKVVETMQKEKMSYCEAVWLWFSSFSIIPFFLLLARLNQCFTNLYQQITELKASHPFIAKIMDGSGEVSLTAEEHEVLTEYFRLHFLSEKGRRIVK